MGTDVAASVESRLLEAFERAYATPGLLKAQGRAFLKSSNTPWAVVEATLAHFVRGTVMATPGDESRHRLRELVADLHLRASLLPEGLRRDLGVEATRVAVLGAIHEAFPPGPLVGRPLGEAVLEDEKAFRAVSAAELEAARASAETLDWRGIPEVEIERAFETNSVYVWLDDSALPFYLPAFLTYSLQHPAGQCEFHTLLSLLEPAPAEAMLGWTRAQGRAIAGFLQYVAEDQPWDSLIRERRQAIAVWLERVG